MTCYERSTTSYHTKVVFYTRTRAATKIPGHFLLVQKIHLMKNKQIANILDCQQILMNPPSHVHKVRHFFLLAWERSFWEIILHPDSTPQTTNKPPDWYNKLNYLQMVHTWHEISTVAAPLRCRQVDPSMAWRTSHGVTRALKERVPFQITWLLRWCSKAQESQVHYNNTHTDSCGCYNIHEEKH